MQPEQRTRSLAATSLVPLALSLVASPLVAQVTIGGAVRVDTGRGTQPCNETTMAASPSNPREIVGGWNDYRQGSPRTGVGLSLDGGATWTDFLLRPPPANQSSVEGDPMTAFDPRTGALWVGGISFTGNGGPFVARKDVGAATFGNAVMARVTGGADKGWMAAGRDPFSANSTRLYIAYNEGCLRSLDMGATFQPIVPLGTGLGFLPRVGPLGQLYVAYWDTGDGVMLRRSFDGGVSFGAPIRMATRMDVWGIDATRFPGDARIASLVALAVDPISGVMYCAYPDTTNVASNGSNVDLYFAKSVDQGANWSVPVVINSDTPSPPGDQFFPWLEVDRSGRVHLLFYDTRRTLQNDSASVALIDAVYSYSNDGGTNWTETFLTASPFTSANDGFGGGFIGDYLGMSTAGERTLPLYMSTQLGNADSFTQAIQHGPATTYCHGIQCPCGNNDPVAGCANRGIDQNLATGASLTATGSASVVSDDLVLSISGMKANAVGLVYTGANVISAPLSDGRRCIAAPFFRYATRTSNGSGVLAYGPGEVVSYANSHFPAAGQIAPGDTRHYQGWYRDANGPCGSGVNLTNALTVTWLP